MLPAVCGSVAAPVVAMAGIGGMIAVGGDGIGVAAADADGAGTPAIAVPSPRQAAA